MQVIQAATGIGPEVREGGLRGWVKTNSDDPFHIVEFKLVPGSEVFPPHIHDLMSEATYVLEGEVRAQIGNDVGVWGVGTLLHARPGVPHAIYAHTSTARVLKIHSPGGEAVKMFERLGRAFAGGRPDPALVAEYLADIDIRLAPTDASLGR